MSACSGFSGGVNTRYETLGLPWPYSDEVTAGIERQIGRDMRVGAMFYYRTNRKQLGVRNDAIPTSTYTPFTFNLPANNPSGVSSVTAYNRALALASAANNVRDNQDYLDTDYKGVELTASKRFSDRWQMVAGLTFGKNEGLLNTNAAAANSGQSATNDLNDPNFLQFGRGIIGNDSDVAFRLSGSYRLPWEVNLAGSLVANGGYPVVTTYTITRADAAAQGITLTQASIPVPLTARGEERLPTVAMVDLRLSRTFSFGMRRISPQLDIFNLTNADTVVAQNNAIGATYLRPNEILSPRIIRFGFSLDF
jgi:hypothetical protein